MGVIFRNGCLVLFDLHYINSSYPHKNSFSPYVSKKSPIFAIKIIDRMVGDLELGHLRVGYFFIRNLSLVLSRIDI